MAARFMLDSGAFSVWSKGHTIDIGAYAEFCQSYPYASYYVSLDVIPGVINQKNMTPEDYKIACEKSWKNYKWLLKKLPFEKLIPVYHQGDPPEWLEKYKSFGTPYVGISPANDQPLTGKQHWLRETKKYVQRKDGSPLIKTHGFGFSAKSLLDVFPWYSVDAATWSYCAAMGMIWVPRRHDGWDYTKRHWQLGVTDRSRMQANYGSHISNLSPGVRKVMDDYITEMGFVWGKSNVVEVKNGYKLEKGELWITKGKTVCRILEKGLTNSREERMKINILFLRKASKHYPVTDFYLAGNPVNLEVEQKITKRLLSYAFVTTGKQSSFTYHHERMKRKCESIGKIS